MRRDDSESVRVVMKMNVEDIRVLERDRRRGWIDGVKSNINMWRPRLVISGK